jgi:hypothetical protein
MRVSTYRSLYSSERIGGEFGRDGERTFDPVRGANVANSNSIKRYPNSTAISHLAVVTRAVEYGFVAAGVTVAAVAVVQSVIIVMRWFGG